MRKNFILILIMLSILAFSSMAFAADPTGIGAIGSTTNQIVKQSYGQELPTAPGAQLVAFIGIFIRSFLAFLGVVFLFLTIYAGFLWMSAQGNESQVDKATKILKTGVIGMILVFASFLIYQTVFLLFS